MSFRKVIWNIFKVYKKRPPFPICCVCQSALYACFVSLSTTLRNPYSPESFPCPALLQRRLYDGVHCLCRSLLAQPQFNACLRLANSGWHPGCHRRSAPWGQLHGNVSSQGARTHFVWRCRKTWMNCTIFSARHFVGKEWNELFRILSDTCVLVSHIWWICISTANGVGFVMWIENIFAKGSRWLWWWPGVWDQSFPALLADVRGSSWRACTVLK